MGDPLSVAASAAGLVSLGLQSVEYLYKFYTACRDRDTDLAHTADQLGDLLRTLQIIDDVLRTRRWRRDETTIVRHIEKSLARCEDVVDELQDECQKFKKEPAADIKRILVVAGRRGAYPFRRSTFEKLHEDVNDFHHNLSIILQALDLKEHQNTQSDLEEIKQVVKSAQAQQVSTGVRQWLKAPDAAVDYNNASSKRHAQTGQWFVQSSAFANWLQQNNSLLWLHGFAGCGKSVLCSTAVQHAFRHQRDHAGSAVAFFFFTFNDESKQDASGALRALLLQLCGQVAGFEAELIRLQSTSNYGTPPLPTLLEYLRQAITRCQNVYLLLDALDECPEEAARVDQTPRADVLSVIEHMRRWRLPGLHLLVTSRDAYDIRGSFEAQNNLDLVEFISMKNGSIDHDIQDYVAYQVDHDRDLRCWTEPQRQHIKDYLSQYAGGV